jgi:hypothetical protein
MKKASIYLLSALSLLVLTLGACESEKENDTEKPEIVFQAPMNCDTIRLGEPFSVRALLSDNLELGSYNIDLHNNFDHHGHTTEEEKCDLDAVKSPVNPFIYQNSFTIDPGLKEFETNISITIPEGFDTGDYHMTITVIDITGWSSFKIIGIKVLESN